MTLMWSKWKIARTCFPYNEGYGVFRTNWMTGKKVITDTGLDKETAQAIADAANGKTNPGPAVK